MHCEKAFTNAGDLKVNFSSNICNFSFHQTFHSPEPYSAAFGHRQERGKNVGRIKIQLRFQQKYF
jgi:hypothetical protein